MIYEINFLVLQSKTAELEKIKKETKKFIESFDATIIEEKEYLKRKLAYEIQHENYGFFTVLRFEFKKNTNLDELKNKLNQKNEVARYIIVRADDLPSLKEQDVKKMEKIYNDKKSIKSEDVEKALKEEERKTAEISKEKKKIETPKKKEEAEKKKEEKEEVKEDKKEETQIEEEKDSKPAEKKASKKTKKEESSESEDDEVSLDELDKKLDEILNS